MQGGKSQNPHPLINQMPKDAAPKIVSLINLLATRRPEQQPNIGTHGSTTPRSQGTPASGRVDWHDKHNWRVHLKLGMTRTEVFRLFGEPEKIHVFSDLETWEYGSGQITFVVEASSPDGALYSWDEPH